MHARRTARWIMAAALLSGASGCGSDDPSAPRPAVYAAYVVLGAGADGSTIAIARAVVEPGDPVCPTLRRGDRSIAMRLRGNPFGFPVNVCEARVQFERRYRLSWTGQALPIARRDPSRLAVLGDTGCKSANCAAGVPAAPFATIAAGIAARQPAPQLVIHVGDYDYRGTASSVPLRGGGSLPVYDAGDNTAHDPQCQLDQPYVSQNADYSLNPDSWDYWSEDFFQPAAPLLAAAPWVMVRGNHELCSRAGPGWFYFLDPNVDASLGGRGELACPAQGGDAPLPPPVLPYLLFAPPYLLDLGRLQLAVVDSANACDSFAPQRTVDIYTEQLATVLGAAKPEVPLWLATHRPVWGVQDESGTPINATLQAAWAAVDSTAPVALMLAGHIHTFQSLTFDPATPPRPPQVIVGSSGVALGTAPTGSFSTTIDGGMAEVLGLEEFSSLQVALDRGDDWNATLIDPSGAELASCATANLPGPLCRE
ncbi:MAG: metallophosphoesterase [Deltaproteobacteria bacterium]|nr:metallophosphoesterase [Deltaproteobacteria bacterium]